MAILLSAIIVAATSLQAKKPQINIVYPKKDAVVGAVDSSFILGSVTPGSSLIINGYNIPVHDGGGFIAFLPLNYGDFEFNISAVNENDTSRFLWPIIAPKAKRSFGYDSLRIFDVKNESCNSVLATGDRLLVDFQATPGCNAWFAVPGLADSVPMAEIPPQVQPYWGETVFGTGAVPESLKIRGYYQGFLDIGYYRQIDSSRIHYFLSVPPLNDIIDKIIEWPAGRIDYNFLSLIHRRGEIIEDSSGYFITVNPVYFPRLVQFTDSVQIMRVGPRRGYLSIFQPRGVKAMAVGREGEWIKLKLSQTQYGWVNEGSIEFLEPGRTPAKSFVRAIRMDSNRDKLTIEIPLADRHPFRVEEESEFTSVLYLYGVNSDTDWIRYDFDDPDIRLAAWSQKEPDLYQLRLEFNRPIWGYDVFYESNILKYQFNKPPQDIDDIEDKVIIIDPGHSPDPGAVGPTGLTEAEANLYIALALKKELLKKGAEVIMTREDMSPLPLYDRPRIANMYDADLFISIHNNALPDGVNPFVNNGVSTYYYHPHSINLARAIQTELLKETKLNDYGLYYGNLAVNRPTQYPAVLVECAFIILPEHEAMLKTDKFRKKIAKAIRKGIERFLDEYERKK